METITETSFPLRLHSRGKVRDTYELGDKLLMVATDRLSAFDVVFREGIPLKGAVLTQLSAFWFGKTGKIIRNHLISTDPSDFGRAAQPFAEKLRHRSMLVSKAQPVKIECVVRGYLSGSGWKSYQKNGVICGIKLPTGLQESSQLPQPIFTPTTKEEVGKHDMDINVQQLAGKTGKDLAKELEEKSLQLYSFAADYARKRGIIIADTKFEFGMRSESGAVIAKGDSMDRDELILIDEALTPDSSRFWPADDWEPGRPQKSFDKQFVRDYLESIGWNKSPPPPPLPKRIIEGTTKKYLEAYEKITGEKFPAK